MIYAQFKTSAKGRDHGANKNNCKETCALFFGVQFSSLKWQRKIKGVSKIEETAFCVGIFSVVVQCEVGKESLGRQG